MKTIYSVFFMSILLGACGGGASSSNKIYEEISSENDVEYTNNDDMKYTGEIEMSQQLHLCPMCQGNRQIQHYYTGELMDCPACRGAGKVSVETIRQLQNAAQSGEELANEVINGGGNEAMSDEGGVRSRDAIEMEIEQCERDKASIEEQLEYVESVTNRSYLSSQLTELNCRIRQLQRELQYAK